MLIFLRVICVKEKTVCFSGHRPEKLPCNGDVSDQNFKIVLSMLCYEIYKSVEQGYTYFITGMAKGIDLWAAKYVIELMHTNKKLHLICALPYCNYGKSWRGVDKWDLEYILYKANEVVNVSERYNSQCMRIRNEYMVDHSSKLIAVVNDYNSGTGQTIRYAQKQNIEISKIDLKTLTYTN